MRRSANFLSFLTLWWMNDIFKRGYSKNLETEDLYELEESDTSFPICENLERKWKLELSEYNVSGKKPSLIRAVWKTYGFKYCLCGILAFGSEALIASAPLLIGGILQYFEGEGTIANAYWSAAGITGIVILAHAFSRQTLRLSQKALSTTTTGKIVNLGATDVIPFDHLFKVAHYAWIGLLLIIYITFLIWREIGISSLVALGLGVIVVISQGIVGRLFGKIWGKTALCTDKRVRMMSEILSAMRLVKVYAWEKPYENMISKKRSQEIKMVLQTSRLKAYYTAMAYVTPRLLIFAALATFVSLGGQLSFLKVFTTVSLINTFIYPLEISLYGVERIAESQVSLRRIEGVSTKWRKTLNDINLDLNNAELVAVIGPVGSGKSSLLNAILGELPLKSGHMKANGTIAYASQIPWVFSGTILENILFGEKYEKERYDQVIYACALTEDLESLEHGSDTLVGERGVTLSGGQKARVNLARAAYRRNTDIVLLDDPLSAVDAKVAEQIFEKCICGIFKHKITLLVTHQLFCLRDVDNILILNEGEVEQIGSYDKLYAKGIDIGILMKRVDVVPALNNYTGAHPAQETTVAARCSDTHCESDDSKLGDNSKKTVFGATQSEEMKAQGSIGWKSYYNYLASNKPAFLLWILLFSCSHVTYVLCDWWISTWVTEFTLFHSSRTLVAVNESLSTNSTTSLPLSNVTDSRVNIGLTVGFTVCMFSNTAVELQNLVKSGRRMHNKMLKAILLAPIRFFDTHPVGRILNRFSKDMGQKFGYVVSVIVISITYNFYVAFVVLPLTLAFWWLRRIYIRTSCDIRRIEGCNRSPVFSHLSSTLQGLATIRGFQMQEHFEHEFYRLQDAHSRAWLSFVAGARWFAMRLDLLNAIFGGCVIFLILLTIPVAGASVGQVGLTIVYVLHLGSAFQWCLKMTTEVENQMTSVERIEQYSKIPPEAPHYIPNSQPPKTWPTNGKITFENFSFAHFDEGPLVLHDISAQIAANEKVGIVGRTGAGKSSLLSCLFRLNELSSGKIYIDDVDISQIGLNALRSSISSIPQDPMLFAGTLRINLDPFSFYEDEEIWNALKKVEMEETIGSFPSKLTMEVTEGGSNFSVGQRQLLCLARAILKRNKILVIDEATANVDTRTDQLIQNSIRETFQDCTVITVAHRINTIIDCDRVMVLAKGRIVEFDQPSKLLLNKDSEFSKMKQAI